MRPGIRLADLLILALAVVLVGWSYLAFWHSDRATGVEVWVDGTHRTTLPLIERRRVEIDGVLGGSLIEIAPGRARFLDSPCQTKRCVHTGWVGEAGMVAACLPNRVSLHILGRDRRYDAINL